jgi:hypothetical protein
MNDLLSDLPWKEVEPGSYAYENRSPLPAMGLNVDDLTPDQQLFADAGVEIPNGQSFPLTELERDILRRKVAANRDAAMLGDSGYERIEADFYPTPPENVDCLLEHFAPHGAPNLIWEPACGKGDISLRLMDYGFETWSSDLHDQGYGTPGMDFLMQAGLPNPNVRSIITNPPYADGLAEKFARHAIKLMQPVRGQVAMFLRNEFDCGKNRMDLFGLPPFHKKIVVTKRPRWIAGSTGSPRHNYAWFIWDWRHKAGSGGIAYSHPDFAPSPATTKH